MERKRLLNSHEYYHQIRKYHNFDSLPKEVHIRRNRHRTSVYWVLFVVACAVNFVALSSEFEFKNITVAVSLILSLFLCFRIFFGSGEILEYKFTEEHLIEGDHMIPWSNLENPSEYNRPGGMIGPTENGILFTMGEDRSIYIPTSNIFITSNPVQKHDLCQLAYMFWKRGNS